MGVVASEIWIDAPIDRVFDVIADFARYPEFVPGVLSCRPLRTVGGLRHVEYEVDLGVRRIRYVLAFREERPTRVAWSLVSGDLLSRSDGSWELTEERGGTRARYAIDLRATPPALVPRAFVDRVIDQLTGVQLPRMMEAFRARAERLA